MTRQVTSGWIGDNPPLPAVEHIGGSKDAPQAPPAAQQKLSWSLRTIAAWMGAFTFVVDISPFPDGVYV